MADSQTMVAVSQERVQKLVQEILGVTNARIAERIVNTINDDSDANHTPSAAAVNTALKSLNHLTQLVIASGDPADASITPNNKTLYIVRKSRTSTIATPYIWVDETTGFVNVGGEETASVDVEVISEAAITAAVSAAATATAPTL